METTRSIFGLSLSTFLLVLGGISNSPAQKLTPGEVVARHLESIGPAAARAAVTRPEESSRQVETRYKLVESFSDFRTVEGLSMPYHWNIRLTTEGRNTSIWEWDMLFARVVQNQPIDPKVFRFLFTRQELRPAVPTAAEEF